VRRQRLALRAVRRLADDGARDVLADDQVAVVVERHPVALVARIAQNGDALLGMPAAPLVRGHVAEVERAVLHPDRPLGEGESRRDLLHLRVLVDEVAELLGMHVDRHTPSLSKLASNLTPGLGSCNDAVQQSEVRGQVLQ